MDEVFDPACAVEEAEMRMVMEVNKLSVHCVRYSGEKQPLVEPTGSEQEVLDILASAFTKSKSRGHKDVNNFSSA
jgi:hypothetical protein